VELDFVHCDRDPVLNQSDPPIIRLYPTSGTQATNRAISNFNWQIENSLSADMRIHQGRSSCYEYDSNNDDAEHHSEDEVKTLINAFPSALYHTTFMADDGDGEQEDHEVLAH